jgi:hypothetical protein
VKSAQAVAPQVKAADFRTVIHHAHACCGQPGKKSILKFRAPKPSTVTLT